MRQINIEAKVIIIRKSQVAEETILLNEIRINQTREQEVQKEPEKNKGQVWENNKIVYVEGRIYIPNNRKI